MDEHQYNHTAEVMSIAQKAGDSLLRIATFPGISASIEDVLTRHQCLVERGDGTFCVVFPEGTLREEILPREPEKERYVLYLPDGYTVWQVWYRHRGKSLLYCE